MAIPKVNLRKIRRKSGISYLLDYTVNGKRTRECVGSNKQTAQEIRVYKAHELATGKFNITSAKQIIKSLDDITSEFLILKEGEIRKTSLTRYKNYLAPFQEFFSYYFPEVAANISLLKTQYLQEFLRDFQKNKYTTKTKWSKKTLNGLIVVLKQLFSFAVKREYLTKNPAKDINVYKDASKEKVEFFSQSDLDLLWSKVDTFWLNFLKFIANTGLRKAEAINLKWESVSLDGQNPQIWVLSDNEWKTKSGKSRVVPLNDNALEILNKIHTKDSEYVFLSREGRKIHPDKPLHALKTALEKCKLKGDVHKLRHTFASHAVMSGMDLFTLAKILGHADIKTTQIYAHLSPSFLQDAVSKINL